MLLNCDIGERGAEHVDDLQLLQYIDIANIACGGHAGDAKSAGAFYSYAKEQGVSPTLHLSYPDRENFGRITLNIPRAELLNSLDAQRSVLPEVSAVKFHGALYNDCVEDEELALQLSAWLLQNDIEQILAPPDSHIALHAAAAGISVLHEGFLDRRYVISPGSLRPELMNRKEQGSCISSVPEAIAQGKRMLTEERVQAYVLGHDKRVTEKTEDIPLKVETLCIHSDSPIALALAEAFARYKLSLTR